jgi:hypothetical protein
MTTDNTWLAATVDPDESSILLLAPGEVVMVSTNGLETRESIAVEIFQGAVWKSLMMGTAVELTARNNTLTLCGPGQYRFNKPQTSNPVGLFKDA